MTELGPLSSDARDLLDAARSADNPTAADRARIRMALAARLGAGVAGIAGAAGTAAVSTSSAGTVVAAGATGASNAVAPAAGAMGATVGIRGLSLLGKVIVGLSLLGGTALVATSVLSPARHASANAPTPLDGAELTSSSVRKPSAETSSVNEVARNVGAAADAPASENSPADGASAEGVHGAANVDPSSSGIEIARSATADEATQEPDHDRAARSRDEVQAGTRRPREQASHVDQTDALEGDVRVLTEAQRAMQQGDPDRALLLLDGNGARTQGPLAAERAASRALALCQAGRADEGARAAAQFLRAHPSSPLATRVRAACPAAHHP